jgi:glutamate 5-kinase
MVKSKNTSHNVYRRVVVKFGTSLLTGGRSSLDEDMMAGLVRQVAELCAQGRDVIIVSSGAIASGKHKLGFTRKIREYHLNRYVLR